VNRLIAQPSLDPSTSIAIAFDTDSQSWPTQRSPSELASSSPTVSSPASNSSCKFHTHNPRSILASARGLVIANGFRVCSDVLHPNRPNVSKDDLRAKLAEVYKSNKDQINVFGMRTQYGGGKSTGFALIYDSVEAMKKFEPHYRLVRVGHATKIEKASRQQRKQRKNRSKEVRGTAKTKGAKKEKK
jgi:small subunit ribosomal protein S24e